jgi:hypothetical protein
MNIYILSLLLLIVGASFLFSYLRKKQKFNKIISNEEAKVVKKLEAIKDFIESNKKEFYSEEVIIEMEKTKEVLAKIDDVLKNWKKHIKKEVAEVKEKAYQEIDKQINFDLLGLARFEAETYVDYKIYANSLLAKMEVHIQQIKVLSILSSLYFGKLKPEVKEREDFLQKFHEYLKSELVFCNFLNSFGDKTQKQLSLVLNRVEAFFNLIQDNNLKEKYTPQFAIFKK